MRNRIFSLMPPVLFALIILFFSSPVRSQLVENRSSGLYDDYLLKENNSDNYTGGYYVNSTADSVKRQSPTVALFKSMLIPGWGQLGNRQYIKAGIAIGLEATFIGAVVHHARKTSDAKEAFENPVDSSLIPALYERYTDIKDKRNYYSWITGLVIFWSMFDAYVDAHLARFPKYDRELSIQMSAGKDEDIRAVLALKF